MPQPISFDIDESVKRLIKVGFTEKQAEEQTQLLSETLRDVIESSLATKQDLKEVELRLELKIAQTKNDTLKWVAGFLLAQTGVIAALVKLL